MIANAGTNGGDGGKINFSSDDDREARIELFGNATLTLNFHTGTGEVGIGSIEGDGLIVLSTNQKLIIGNNNLSTTFSGTIQDVGSGSLEKVGKGTLTLTGASTYRHGTTIAGGKLVVANQTGSGTGSGPVSVTRGKLGGNGIIAGATTIGTGSGMGAFLAPAAGTTMQATLTIQSTLIFNTDATYTCTFKANPNRARTDMVIANGVTINSGASIALSGHIMGTLRQGMVLILISNTSANPISDTFSNLPDGAIVTINGNNFQASYSGGDGNIANGVTINSGAMIALIGHTMGTLTQGMVLTLISNTSANPVNGTFNNLPDGSIVTISGNNFQVSYEGGDGNDLTLTVVP